MMKKMMKMMKMTVVSVLLAASVCLQRTVSEHRLYGTVGMKLQWDCNYTGLITDIKTVSWQDPHKDTYMYQFNCQPTNCSHKCEEKSNPTNLVNILCDEISSGMFSLIFKKPNMTQNNTKYELRLALEKENDESKIICEVTLHLSDADPVTPTDDRLLGLVAIPFVAVAVLVGIIYCYRRKKNGAERDSTHTASFRTKRKEQPALPNEENKDEGPLAGQEEGAPALPAQQKEVTPEPPTENDNMLTSN